MTRALRTLLCCVVAVGVASARLDISGPVGTVELRPNAVLSGKFGPLAGNRYLAQSRNVYEGVNVFSQLPWTVGPNGLTRALTEDQQDAWAIADSTRMVQVNQRYVEGVGTQNWTPQSPYPLTGEKGVSSAYSLETGGSWLSWHPSGQYLVVSGLLSGATNLHLYKFDMPTCTFTLLSDVAVLGSGSSFLACWSPDGKYLAGSLKIANGSGQEVTCFAFNGERLTELEGCRYETGAYCYGGLQWSPDGKWFAVAGQSDKVCRIFAFDGAKFTLAGSITTPGNTPSGLGWHPSGKFIAFTLGNVSGSGIYAWNGTSLTLMDRISSGVSEYTLGWSPNGKYLATGVVGASSSELRVFVFNGSKAQLVASWTLSGFRYLDSLVWSNDGNYIFAGYESDGSWTAGKIKVFSFSNNKLIPLQRCDQTPPGGVDAITVHPTLPLVATLSKLSSNMVFQLWNFQDGGTGQEEQLDELTGCNKTSPSANNQGFGWVRWSPDGQYVAVSENYGDIDGRLLIVYQMVNGSLIQRATFNNGDEVRFFAWHPTGKYIAFTSETAPNIRVIKFDGYSLTLLPACDRSGGYNNVDWHPSGNYLVVANGSGTADCYSFANEKLSFVASATHGATMYVVAWHPSGQFLVIGDRYYATNTCNLRLFAFYGAGGFVEVTTARYLLDINSCVYHGVTWSADGNYLAVPAHDTGDGYGFRILSFSGTAFTELTNTKVLESYCSARDVSWLNGSQYVIIGNSVSASQPPFRLYRFDGTSLVEINTNVPSFTINSWSQAASPNGKYIAVAGYNSVGGVHLAVYPVLNGLSLQQRRNAADAANATLSTNISKLTDEVAAHSNALIGVYHSMVDEISGYQSLTATSSNLATEASVNAVDWSANGRYLAFGTNDIVGGYRLRMYDYHDDIMALVTSGTWDMGYSATVKDVAWHPQGTHLAVASAVTKTVGATTTYQINVFALTPTGLEEIESAERTRTGGTGPDIETIEAIDWSPDGRFLIAAGYGPTVQARIYGFDYQQTLAELSTIAIAYGTTSTVYDVAWHPSGNHIALVGDVGASGEHVRINSFVQSDGAADGYVSASEATYVACETRYGAAWSPDGTALVAVGGRDDRPGKGAEIMAFSFDPTLLALSHLDGCDFTHGGTVAAAAWVDSQRVAITGYTGVGGAHTRVLSFANNAFTEIADAAITTTTGVPVRYGDAITLKHNVTGKFLQSQLLRYWQPGTLQDTDYVYYVMVSCVPQESVSSKFLVKGTSGTTRWNCTFGTPVRYGDLIRLENVQTHGALFTSYSAAPVSPFSTYYACHTAMRKGVNLGYPFDDGARDCWTIGGGTTGDEVLSGQRITLTNSYFSTPPLHNLYSHDVDFETVQNSNIFEQEVVSYTVVDGNEQWMISSVDHGAYVDQTEVPNESPLKTVKGGVRGGSGRSVAVRPDGLALGLGGGLDQQGCGAHVEPFTWDTVKDFTLTDTRSEIRLGSKLTGCSKVGTCTAASWSPDARFLTLGLLNDVGGVSHIRVYQFDGMNLIELPTAAITGAASQEYAVLDWDPSGRYFIARTRGTTAFAIYRFDFKSGGSTSTAVVSRTSSGAPPYNGAFSWHPSGRFFAMGGNIGSVVLYAFDNLPGSEGVAPLQSIGFGGTGPLVESAKWSSSGRYLLIGGTNSTATEYRIYQFNGSSTLTELPGCRVRPAGGMTGLLGFTIAWHPSEQFVVLAPAQQATTCTVYLYRFDGASLTLLDQEDSVMGPLSLDWSHDGDLVAVSGRNRFGRDIAVYKFTGTKLTELPYCAKLQAVDPTNPYVLRATFSPMGDYLLANGGAATSGAFEIYPVIRDPLMVADSWASVSLQEKAKSVEVLANDTLLAVDNNAPDRVANSWAILALRDLNTTTSQAIVRQKLGISEITGIGTPMIGTPAPTGRVYNCDWSPDGNYIAVTDFDLPGVYIYRQINGVMTQITSVVTTANSPWSIRWHPSGRYLAIGTATVAASGKAVYLYRFEDEALTQVGLWILPVNITITGLDWHPSGRWLLGGLTATDGPLYMSSFDVDTGTLGLPQIVGKVALGVSCRPRTVRWSPNGKYVAVTDDSGALILEIFSFSEEDQDLTAITQVSVPGGASDCRWTPDGNYVVTADMSAPYKLYVYQFDGDALTWKWEAIPFGGAVRGFDVSSDGRYVAVGGGTTSHIIYRNNQDGTLTQLYTITTPSVNWLRPEFSPDVSLLAAPLYDPHQLYVYPFGKSSLIVNNSWAIQHLSEHLAPTLATSTAVVGYPSRYTTLSAFEVTTSDAIVTLHDNTTPADLAARWDPSALKKLLIDNSYAVMGIDEQEKADSNLIVNLDARERADSNAIAQQAGDIYDLKLGAELAGCSLSGLCGPTNVVNSYNWSPDGRYVAIGNDAGGASYTVRIYRFDPYAKTLTELTAARVLTAGVFGIVWRSDGKYIAVAGLTDAAGNNLKIYRFENETLTLVINAAMLGNCGAGELLSWRPDGNFIAIARSTNTGTGELFVYAFDATRYAESLTPIAQGEFGADAVFAEWDPSGQYVAVGGSSNGTSVCKIFSFDGTSLTDLTNAYVPAAITSLWHGAWHPSGKFLAVGGNGNTVYVYAFNGNVALAPLATAGFGAGIVHCSWSQDGKYLAVTGYLNSSVDTRIFLFDGASLTEMVQARKQAMAGGSFGHAIHFSSDDRFVAVSGYGGLLKVYQVEERTMIMNNSWAIDNVDNLIIDNSWAVRHVDDVECANSNALVANSCAVSQITGLNEPIVTVAGDAFGVAWHPSGKYCVLCRVASPQLQIYQRTGSTFTQVASAVHSSGTNLLFAAAWHPDGVHLAVGGNVGNSGYTLRVYKFVNGMLIEVAARVMSGTSGVWALDWHPSGAYLLAGTTADGKVGVYAFDASTSTLGASPTIFHTQGATLYRVAWNPGGKFAAGSYFVAGYAGASANVRIFSFTPGTVPTATLLDTAALGASYCRHIAWSPSGDLVSCACQTTFNGIKILRFNGYNLALQRTLTADIGFPMCTQFDRSGTRLFASGNSDYGIRVYAVAPDLSMTLLDSHPGIGAEANTSRLDPSESMYAAAGHAGGFYVWPVARSSQIYNNSWAVQAARDHLADIATLSVDNSNALVTLDRLNTANSYAIVKCYAELFPYGYSNGSREVATSNSLVALAAACAADSNALVVQHQELCPNGYNTLAATSANLYAANALTRSIVADSKQLAANSQAVTEIVGLNDSPPGYTVASGSGLTAAWSPDGAYLAIGSFSSGGISGRVYRRSGMSLIELVDCRIAEPTAALRGIFWHPSGKYLAAAFNTSTGALRIYRFESTQAGNETLTLVASASMTATNYARSIAWHPSGNFISYAGDVSTPNLHVFKFVADRTAESLTEIASATHGALLNFTAWSPDGYWLLTGGALGGGCNVRLYSFDGTSVLTEIVAARTNLDAGGALWEGQWHPTLPLLAITGYSTNLFLCSFNGTTLSTVQMITTPTFLTSCCWSPSGTHLFVCGDPSENPNVLVYRLTGNTLTELLAGRKYQGTTYCRQVACSPDESLLAVAGYLSPAFAVYPITHASLIDRNKWAIQVVGEQYDALHKFNDCAITTQLRRDGQNSSAISRAVATIFPNGYAQPSLISTNSVSLINLSERELANSTVIRTNYDEIWPVGDDYLNPSNVLTDGTLDYNNSWAIEHIDDGLTAAEGKILTNSDDVVLLKGRVDTCETNLGIHDGEIIALQEQLPPITAHLGSIDTNVADLWFYTGGTTTFTYNLNLAPNHKMHITNFVSLYGNGCTITLPSPASGVIVLDDNAYLTLRSTKIENFSDAQILRGTNSTLRFGSGAIVSLGGDQTLTKPWLCDANPTINGNGATLTLGDGGLITVGSTTPGSRLTIRNLTIANVLQSNLICDAKSSIVFENVTLSIPFIYRFPAGSFAVSSLFKCDGPGIFVYESIEASTIQSQSEWLLSPGITLSYAPTNTFDNRIYFTDSTSKLHLDSATLVATYTGLNLNTGTLVLSGHNYANVSTVIDDDGVPLSFGTGEVSKNLYVSVNPGGSLDMVRGFLDYRNVEALA